MLPILLIHCSVLHYKCIATIRLHYVYNDGPFLIVAAGLFEYKEFSFLIEAAGRLWIKR